MIALRTDQKRVPWKLSLQKLGSYVMTYVHQTGCEEGLCEVDEGEYYSSGKV